MVIEETLSTIGADNFLMAQLHHCKWNERLYWLHRVHNIVAHVKETYYLYGDLDIWFSLILYHSKRRWEGVAHFALHCWNENRKKPCYDCISSLSQKLDLVSVNLLHVAIGTISTSNPTFRKACLTAAVSLPPDVYHRLIQNQRKAFFHLIDKIRNECKISEVLSNVEVAIQKNKDPFEQIRWLQVLHMENEAKSRFNTEKSLNIEDLRSLCATHKNKLEAAFLSVKSRFCSEVVFEDVVTSHRMLLLKYKKTRRQYINGMISLHNKL